MRNATIIMLMLWAVQSTAQSNLVPNPSFEEFTQCPTHQGQLLYVVYWEKVGGGGGVDYFHECGTGCCPLHDNVVGGQTPRTGSAYVDYVMMHNNHVVPGQQGNFIGIALSDSLKSGHKYDAEFYLSLCDSARFASRNVGLHISNGQPNSDIDSLLSIVPEVRYDGPFLSDKEGWMRIFGSFFAQGGENYLTIGNFDGAENSDTLNLHEGGMDPTEEYWEVAAYFLDDVSLVEDTSYHVGIESRPFGSAQGPMVKLWPNPASEIVSIELQATNPKLERLVVYNAMGRKVLRQGFDSAQPDGKLDLDVSSWENGVYVFNLWDDNGTVQRKKLVIQH